MNERTNGTPSSAPDPVAATDDLAEEPVAAGIPVRATSERETVAYRRVAPRTTVIDPYPPPPPGMLARRPFGVGGPGPGVILLILVAVLGLVLLLALFVARGNQPATVTAPAPIATDVGAQAPPPPAPQAAAPQPAAPVNPPPATAVQPAAAAPPPAAAPATSAAAPAPAPAVAPAPAAPVAAAPVAPADTPAGTVLDAGGTWRENGLELTMGSPRLSPGGVTASFSLKNTTANPIRFQFTRGTVFSATDNRNNRLTINDPNYRYDFTLQPNATVNLDTNELGGPISFSGALSSPQATGITVTVNGLQGITNAQWRIAVQH